MAKRKLDFEKTTDENEPPSKRNIRSTRVCTAVILYLQKNFVKSIKHAFIVFIGNIECVLQAAAEKEEALPHGTRLIDLDTFRKRLQSCTHIVSQVNVRTHSEKSLTGMDFA